MPDQHWYDRARLKKQAPEPRFQLGTRSRANLSGVHADLVLVVERAIAVTPVDFGVSEGLRSLARQQEMVATGASGTMNSRHLTGHAVDLMAYENGEVSWNWPLYYKIADAMRQAAVEVGVPIVWGAAWARVLNDFGTARKASNEYVDERRAQDRTPFMDGPHFELLWAEYPA